MEKTLITTIDGVEIYFEALEEYSSPHDLFEAEDAEQICIDIDRGELVFFCAKVSAEKNGAEMAADYLGGCCYSSYEDFYNAKGDYFEDMQRTVLDEVKQIEQEEIKVLKVTHEKIRTILRDSGAKEYGDHIIDNICNVAGIKDTTSYYLEGN